MSVYNFKLAVCGSGGVGKSCITIQYVKNQFVESWDPTIEDSYQKTITVDGHTVQLDILDTAGQEEYKGLRDEYMRTADAFLLVFDITRSLSFDSLTEFYKQICRSKDCDNPCVALVGNKCDLPPEDRQVTMEHIREAENKWKTRYVECSAKTKTNIDDAFLLVVKDVLNKKIQKEQQKAKVQATTTEKPKKSCIIL
ncbi:hypothetical protein ABK040_001273 [Willaertia magna]